MLCPDSNWPEQLLPKDVKTGIRRGIRDSEIAVAKVARHWEIYRPIQDRSASFAVAQFSE
ncbi:MAG: hypothetical protein JWM11_3434 [Planctomycetaceae bacterium]|nr:hypothetical protein [Planctomycetaceae bacterium]